MIRRARLRLTLWYSAVLLALLLSLSIVTYTAVTRTLRRELEDGISSAVTQWLEVPRRTPITRPAELPGGRGPGFAGRSSATPGATAPPPPSIPSATPDANASVTAASSATPSGTITPRGSATPRTDRQRLDPRLLFPEFETETADLGATSDVFLLVYRSDGVLALNPRRVDAEDITKSDAVSRALAGQASWATIQEDGVRLRIYASPITLAAGRTDGAIVGARNLDEYDRQIRAIFVVLAMVAVGGGLLSLGGAYMFAGRALQPLEDAYDRQRSFVADASHELRSPLAVIRVSADLLLRESLPPAHRESVEEIRDVTQEASTLVDDLLELAHAEEGAPSHAESQLAEEAAAVIDQLRELLERRGHTITTVLAPVRGAAAGPEVRRIVRALLENVAAHTPEGTPVRVEVTERSGHAILAVEDRGPGIPDGQESKVFERFARLDEARTPGTGHGAGLGLAIVRSLAERRGGSVSATRPASGGLRIEVSLPLAR
ncbi:MAG: HAMP domain-containing histidine kinase [Dehalococcoidia bacterium]|nr:MAG: HAMP domain-containing histidine kinase [Dehalococcoidia bacterium]